MQKSGRTPRRRGLFLDLEIAYASTQLTTARVFRRPFTGRLDAGTPMCFFILSLVCPSLRGRLSRNSGCAPYWYSWSMGSCSLIRMPSKDGVMKLTFVKYTWPTDFRELSIARQSKSPVWLYGKSRMPWPRVDGSVRELFCRPVNRRCRFN